MFPGFPTFGFTKKCILLCPPLGNTARNNVSWFIQLREQIFAGKQRFLLCSALGNQFFLVNTALGDMSRKQCFLVCPALRNMARKHCFMFSSLGNWCFLIICSPLGNITIGNTASLFTQLWKTWLGNNVSWFVQLWETWLGNTVSCFPALGIDVSL